MYIALKIVEKGVSGFEKKSSSSTPETASQATGSTEKKHDNEKEKCAVHVVAGRVGDWWHTEKHWIYRKKLQGWWVDGLPSPLRPRGGKPKVKLYHSCMNWVLVEPNETTKSIKCERNRKEHKKTTVCDLVQGRRRRRRTGV